MPIKYKPLQARGAFNRLCRRFGFMGIAALLLATGQAYAVNDPGNVKVAQMSNSSMKVTWTDNSSNETGFRIERRIFSSGSWGSWSLQNTTAANATDWTQSSSLTSGTVYQYRVRANGSPNSNFVESNPHTFHTFATTNLGVGMTPTMTYSNGIMTIEAAGTGIEGTVDSFYFVSANLAGDGQIVARIDSITNTDSGTQAGVMIRDELGTNASHAALLLFPTAGSSFAYRTAVSGSTVDSWGNNDEGVRYLNDPKWIKLIRKSGVITSYASDDGLCWTVREFNGTEKSVSLTYASGDAYFGIALASNVGGTEATTVISNLQVEGVIDDPVNKNCPRAAVDTELPVPGSWIMAPGKFSGTDWDYTTSNPNTSPSEELCPGEGDDLPDYVGRRRDGPDHPNCVVNTEMLNWTDPSYDSSSWADDPAGFGNTPVLEGDVKNTAWTADSLWLRKTFTLSSQTQADELVLWGRWSCGLTVYINGVLATSFREGRSIYSYLGLSNQARAALDTNGTNVIAVRLAAFDWVYDDGEPDDVGTAGCDNKFFDLGIAQNAELADLYVNDLVTPLTDSLALFASTMKDYLQQWGIPGGVMAVLDNGNVVANHVFGYKNASLTTNMPNDAILRLASVDKTVTQAIIYKLIDLGWGGLTPTTKVFEYLNDAGGLNLGIQVIPGASFDSDIEDITVDHLMRHKSGIPGHDSSQKGIEQIAFSLGISPDAWEPIHLARWIYSQSIDPPPLAGDEYSSNGFFLLRYLAEEIIKEETSGSGDLESFMETQMGLGDDITVSHERVGAGERDLTREPGYVNMDPIHDRHAALEKYFALGASAEGMALFFNNFGMEYVLDGNGDYQPTGPHNAGRMDGTWSMVKHNADKGRAVVMMTTMSGHFDELGTKLESLKEQPECNWEHFDAPGDDKTLFIQNFWQVSRYLHAETLSLQAGPIDNDGWHSPQWVLNKVGTSPDKYTIQNFWDASDEYLYFDSTDNTPKMQAGPPGSNTRYQWIFEQVGSSDEYRIKSVYDTSRYLNIENHNSQNHNFPEYLVQATNLDDSYWSTRWRFCDSNPGN